MAYDTPAVGLTGYVLQSVLGLNVYAALQNAVNAASGFVQLGGSAIGAGVQSALSVATNAANGLLQLNGSGTVPQANITAAAHTLATATPAGPSSTSALKMQGIAASITPTRTGTIMVTVSGYIASSGQGVIGAGIAFQIAYGTGAAPGSNATATGTVSGGQQSVTNPTAATPADISYPFSISTVLSGLSVGTAYWIDLQAIAFVGTGFYFPGVTVAAIEQ